MSTALTSGDAGASRKGHTGIIIATSLMLFSMFFGAGNLIFPPQLGVNAGENFWPAILGFLGAGVLLPVLGIIAIALSGNSVSDLARRAGVVFGIVFPILAYLSIGAFYALPRTGAVSFEIAITPLTGWEGLGASAIFNLVFFGVSLVLSWNPNTIVDSLGKFLTPVLVVLLLVLIGISIFRFDTISRTPTEDFVSNPAATGLLEGYLTMDAIASLAFSIVVISSLRHKGLGEGKPLVKGTITAGLIAGALLAMIYVGLGVVGRVLPGAEDLENGAGMLSVAANATMGFPGQILFAVIVLLACLTTSVGLITSTSEFFESLVPGLKYHFWVVLFSLAATAMATLGLETVLAVAAPVIGLIYPPAITLIFLALLEPALRGRIHFYWTFRIAIWVAVIWSALSTLQSLGWGASVIDPIVSWAPLQSASLGWVLPTVIGLIIGLILDAVRPHEPAPAPAATPEREAAAL
ncbi:branched-chain amino acid transport system II carrier protein [Corynebacterium doosanense]|uniref:Amino acid:cation symporter n=1 Tax=Corynebacterium doosanense CAU 212 = DSM 45436 TaxID=558173 RepID=A0A097IHI0_9CORY|nr:branched-chain amino acid transport system II carrier protein [Corynebacterium doosanense]AIT61602.1 amino acid:cation symporter [Corynebacterium doosanense CAU 212 = DSM 45436]